MVIKTHLILKSRMCQKHKVDFWPSYGLSQKTEASGLKGLAEDSAGMGSVDGGQVIFTPHATDAERKC